MLLVLCTSIDASSAKNTSSRIIGQQGMAHSGVPFPDQGFEVLYFQGNTQKLCHLLESAALVGRAVTAIDPVRRKQKLQGGALHMPHSGTLCIDHHTIVDFCLTGGNGMVHTLNLDKA